MRIDLSVIVPIYNERDNILPLHAELTGVLGPLGISYELLLVDDGSIDGSRQRLIDLASEDDHVRVLRFRRNFGQTAALQAGLENARGQVIVTIDGDLQNDPADIPSMLDKLAEGYDLVHGWRRQRQDAWLNRRLPSQLANRLIAWTTGVPIHDLGCTLKAMRREIADELELYGQMHRFIPILAAQRGARCIEVETHHRARQHGQTKYGIARTLQVLLDLCTIKYMLDYFANPMRLFGRLATFCFAAGGVAGCATAMMKWQRDVDMTGNPLLLLCVVCWLTGLQLLSLGLLGEVCARIYYQRDRRRPFAIAERWGAEETHTAVRSAA
jgi:glycosyltransferase involved in cell wall biosynthesis